MIIENYNVKQHKDNIHTLVNRVNNEDLSTNVKDRLLAHIKKECDILINLYNVDYTALAFECVKC